MNINGSKLRQLEADGWVVASGLWTAAGHQLLLHRGESEMFVTVTDEDQGSVAEPPACEVIAGSGLAMIYTGLVVGGAQRLVFASRQTQKTDAAREFRSRNGGAR